MVPQLSLGFARHSSLERHETASRFSKGPAALQPRSIYPPPDSDPCSDLDLAHPQENGLTDEHRGNDKSGAASLAASISVIDRYVAALRTPLPPPPPPLPPIPLARKNEPPHLRGRANDTCQGSSRRARGQDAADAVINIGDPEFSTVLTAWEAVVAKEGGNGDGKEGEEEEAGGRGDEGENGEEEEEGPTHNGTGTAQCIDNCARREMKPTPDVGASAHRTNPPCSLTERAREALRALDTADPQSALLGAANAWVVKPAGLSCGRGVVAASSLRGLVLACHRLRWKAVVQKYVERPLLVQVCAQGRGVADELTKRSVPT